jgi:hypothetical protein
LGLTEPEKGRRGIVGREKGEGAAQDEPGVRDEPAIAQSASIFMAAKVSKDLVHDFCGKSTIVGEQEVTAISSTKGVNGKFVFWDVFKEFPISQSVLT